MINGFGFLLIIGFYPRLLSRDLHHRLHAKPYSGLWRRTSKAYEISANNEKVLLERSSGRLSLSDFAFLYDCSRNEISSIENLIFSGVLFSPLYAARWVFFYHDAKRPLAALKQLKVPAVESQAFASEGGDFRCWHLGGHGDGVRPMSAFGGKADIG